MYVQMLFCTFCFDLSVIFFVITKLDSSVCCFRKCCQCDKSDIVNIATDQLMVVTKQTTFRPIYVRSLAAVTPLLIKEFKATSVVHAETMLKTNPKLKSKNCPKENICRQSRSWAQRRNTQCQLQIVLY